MIHPVEGRKNLGIKMVVRWRCWRRAMQVGGVSLAIILVAFLGGCRQSGSPYLMINLGAEPSTLDPTMVVDSASGAVTGYLFSGLFQVNSALEIVPDLVSTYSISTDHRQYRFTLRPNCRWHDGRPLTAADVKFTFDRILSPTGNSPRRSDFMVDGQPIQWVVLDSRTIVATLPRPFAPFLSHLTMGILPAHLKSEIESGIFSRHPVGSGPFGLARWESGQFVRLSRFASYYKAGPKLPGMMMKIIPNSHTALAGLVRGELDIADIPNSEFKRISARSDLRTFRSPGLSYSYIGFNLRTWPFSDPRIRQAVCESVDRTAIIQAALNGYGKPVDAPASPGIWTYPAHHSIVVRNLAHANGILDQLGYRYGSDGFRYHNGKKLTFTLLTNKGNPDRELAAQIIQQNLRQIGIDMHIQLLEWSTLVKRVTAGHPKPFDAVLLGWQGGVDPDCYAIWHSSQYPNGLNTVGYSNPLVDRLLELGRTTIDRQKRIEIYHQIYAAIVADRPYCLLYAPDGLDGFRNRVHGYQKPGPGGMLTPIESVYIDPN